MKRREFLAKVSAVSTTAYFAPANHNQKQTFTDDRKFPNITHGVASGDVTADSAVIWSRTDRAAQMIIEVSADENFRKVKKWHGPNVLEGSDFTGNCLVRQLPDSPRVHYRVRFRDLANTERIGPAVTGSFAKVDESKPVKFAWSGDTAGQGFGIDPSRGGMKTYDAILRQKPDFFVHSGDVCYADGPFSSELKLDDGSIWKNLTTEATSKVAESLSEFRANFQYNLLDENVRRLQQSVPVMAQWDDHETTNNWFPGEQLLDDDRYTVKSASLLAARAKQAFFEYLPIRPSQLNQIYRKISRGPLLDLFFLDLRTYKSANSKNVQDRGPETDFLGRKQLAWLKRQLKQSTATWKFICSDMPIGLIVSDGECFENGANGDPGLPKGRELEIARLLSFIQQERIRNVVFITADVHYAASHFYNPNLASFQAFDPFWEFVSGPLHAGTFGPNELDRTFGPEVKFSSVDPLTKPNRPPSEGLQFFGVVSIDAESKVANIAHHNRSGHRIWQIDLKPNF